MLPDQDGDLVGVGDDAPVAGVDPLDPQVRAGPVQVLQEHVREEAVALLVDHEDGHVGVQDGAPAGAPDHVRAVDPEAVNSVAAQLWDAVAVEDTDPRLRRRIASFTSLSGPSLDHVAWLTHHAHGRRGALLRQLLHSWYMAYFCLPVVPGLMWRLLHRPLGRAGEMREGLPRGHWGPELGRNAVHGLGIYRANVFRRARRRAVLHTEVPVLVVHQQRDHFLTDVFLQDLDRACPDLRVERIDAGHWGIVTHADEVAALVRQHVTGHTGH